MKSRAATAATLGLALIGLAASVALAIDHLGPAPAYCAEGGCITVRASVWSRPLGIPTPLIGAGFFAIVVVLAALAPRAGDLRRGWSFAGGAIGIGFLVLQGAVIEAWCELCIVVDVAALALAVLAAVTARLAPIGRAGRAIAVGLATAAVAGPIGFAHVTAPALAAASVTTTLPAVIAREQVPEVVTIVEFIDFECPFCRALHVQLEAALAAVDRPVRVVRKMLPLPAHAGAVPAALAWYAADAQGKGDAMAAALLAAPTASLTPAGCAQLAAGLGLEPDAYRAACASEATRARLAEDAAAATAAGVTMLPTLYVGSVRFAGARVTVAELVAALRAE